MTYPNYPDFESEYQEREFQIQAIGNMYALITEQEPYSFQSACDAHSYTEWPHVFAEHGIRWNHLIEHDVNAILSLQPVRYFKPVWAWVEEYRAIHGIWYEKPAMRARTWDEVIRDTESYIDQIEREHKEHGISLWMDEMGYACHNEQMYFYQTQQWQVRAAAARYEWDYKCNRCKARNKPLHVHHLSPIVTAYHPNFTKCFEGYRMIVLCGDCHQQEHSITVRSAYNYSFYGASLEEVKEEKEYLRKRKHVHDKLKTCKFCLAKGYFE